jgi:hypothetical protein
MNAHPRLTINSGHLIKINQNELSILNCNTCFGKHMLVHALSHVAHAYVIPMMLMVVRHLDKIKHVFHAFIVCSSVPTFQLVANCHKFPFAFNM